MNCKQTVFVGRMILVIYVIQCNIAMITKIQMEVHAGIFAKVELLLTVYHTASLVVRIVLVHKVGTAQIQLTVI